MTNQEIAKALGRALDDAQRSLTQWRFDDDGELGVMVRASVVESARDVLAKELAQLTDVEPVVVARDAEGNPPPFESFPSLNGDRWDDSEGAR